MFSTCANPDCSKPFDYRQGHFFRFHKANRPDGAPPNTHSVQHLWLCGHCCEEYTLQYVEGHGVVLLHRMENSLDSEPTRCVFAALT